MRGFFSLFRLPGQGGKSLPKPTLVTGLEGLIAAQATVLPAAVAAIATAAAVAAAAPAAAAAAPGAAAAAK